MSDQEKVKTFSYFYKDPFPRAEYDFQKAMQNLIVKHVGLWLEKHESDVREGALRTEDATKIKYYKELHAAASHI